MPLCLVSLMGIQGTMTGHWPSSVVAPYMSTRTHVDHLVGQQCGLQQPGVC